MTTFIYQLSILFFMLRINFQELGLTKVEGKVYIALIKLGSTKTGPLVKRTELHRATVYDALKRLIEKGLATHIIKEKTKYFQATPPKHFLDIIEEEKIDLEAKEFHVKNIIKDLEKIQEQAKIKESAQIYQGKRGLKTIFEDILNYKYIYSFASKGKFGETLGAYFNQFQNKKKLKKINDKILINEEFKGSKYVKSIYGETRFLPKDYEYPTATIIYGYKVAIFVFTEYPIAFVIESKEVTDSYRTYFELLWKKSIT
jgi:sugar-specific transcriptional regulator TrmB